MSLGDAIRGLIDPLDPAVRAWLQRELPHLAREGYIDATQADSIARRYGVALDPASMAAVPVTQAASAPAMTTEAMPVGDVAGADPAEVAAPHQPGLTAPPPGPAAPPSGGPAPAPAGTPPHPSTSPGPGPVPAARPAASPFMADHAVSIVLYLGAFLVVAAVVIFLAYSWGDISGGAKLAVLALLSAGFLGAAWLCLPRPAVRPAGRTFLALGAILVPANVAASYVVYFEDSSIPGAVFWLLGAAISGALHALLSWRLDSRAYGVLATISVPIGSAALGWLIVPDKPWLGQIWVFGPAAAIGLVATLAAARWQPPIPLVQSARVVASLLLPLAFLVSLPFLEQTDEGQFSTPITLLLMSGGLAWEATRGGRTWWIGAVAGLLMLLPLAIALTEAGDSDLLVAAVILTSLIGALVARRLPTRQRVLWDVSAVVPALVFPFVTWSEDWACLLLFASLAAVAGIVAWGWRSPLPLYAAVLAVDGAYVKLLDVYGSPDSPTWALGVALWPLGVLWAVLGGVLPRRLSGPCWAGALVTLLAAMAITWDQSGWCLGIVATGAAATVVAAWRLRVAPVLPLAVPWLLLVGYQGADALRLEMPWRIVMAGVTGWLLIAVSLLRPYGPAPGPSREEPLTLDAGEPPSPSPVSEVAAAPDPVAGESPAPSRGSAVQGLTSAAGRTRLPIGPSLALDWALPARIGAVAVAGLAALPLLAGLDRSDAWLEAGAVAWLNVALVLAAWSALARVRDLALLAALSLVPALYCGIARLHPTDGQAYAVPIGLYLLGVAFVTRRDRRPGHPEAASVIAALGLLVVLGTTFVQSLDRDRFDRALLTLAEGLVLVGIGIAMRWRVLVVAGVTTTVIVAVRQLFDAVAALPGWAILGGSGLLLLGSAVVLLLARARVAAAGRSVAERWSGWD